MIRSRSLVVLKYCFCAAFRLLPMATEETPLLRRRTREAKCLSYLGVPHSPPPTELNPHRIFRCYFRICQKDLRKRVHWFSPRDLKPRPQRLNSEAPRKGFDGGSGLYVPPFLLSAPVTIPFRPAGCCCPEKPPLGIPPSVVRWRGATLFIHELVCGLVHP